MSRRLLFLPLFAVLPALLCAQQPKLINCRTLEAAGNFVGPDEVIVDDLVCQKAKPGTQTNFSPQVPKPIPGVVISGDDSESVVDAAKAASKRVTAAKDAIREKAGQAGEQVTPAVPPTEPPATAAPVETPAAPPPVAEPARAPETARPAPRQPVSLPATSQRPVVAETPPPPPDTGATAASPPQQASATDSNPSAAKSRPAGSTEIPVTPAAQEAISSSTDAVNQTTSPENVSSPKANESAASAPAPPQQAPAPEPPPPSSVPPQPAATAASEPTRTEITPSAQQVTTPEPAAAETAASPEIVLKSAPPARQPTPATTTPTTVETPPTSSATAPPSAETPPPAESVSPAAGTGFYDANAGTNVVTNPRPGDAPNAPAAAPAEPRKPSEAELAAAAAAKAAAEEAEASLRAPDPNLPRERVVETGGFAEPKEVGPDPTTLAHKTTFQPGDSEGFEEGHRADCTKNITIAGLKGEKLVLGTPSWATRWIEKNEKRLPRICFSDTPMTSAKNYLIVFYTAPVNTNATQAADATGTPQGAPAGGVGAFTLSYGSTWHYAQERNVGVTVLTRDEADEPQADLGKVWYATAYTEEGVPVSEHWPEKAKKQIHVDDKDTKSKKAREARAEIERVSDDLLDQMVADIAKL
jgi:hypothetical protein